MWQRGYSFVELLVVTTIVLILASAVQPLAKVTSAVRIYDVKSGSELTVLDGTRYSDWQ